MSTTTSTACVNDFEERYNRLQISIIVVACITGIFAIFSIIIYFKRKSISKVSPNLTERPNNSLAYNNFMKNLNDFINNISLEEFTINEYLNTEENVQCSMCLKNILINQKVSELRCCHKFHKECIMEWFTHGNNNCISCNETIII